MNPDVLLGVSADAGTTMSNLQAVVEEAKSPVPGFAIPYAISTVLLTAWGPVVVAPGWRVFLSCRRK